MNFSILAPTLCLLPLVTSLQEPDNEAERREFMAQEQRALEDAIAKTRAELQVSTLSRDSRRSAAFEIQARMEKLAMRGHEAGLGDPAGAGLAVLRNRLDETRLEKRVMAARRDAIEEQLERLAKEMEVHVQEDPMLHELRSAVDLLNEHVSRVMALHEHQSVSESEVIEARLRLVDARARMAEHEMTLRERRGQGLVRSLREQLVELEIELHVQGVREMLLEERMERTSVLARSLRDERLELETELAQRAQELEELEIQMRVLRERAIDLEDRRRSIQWEGR